MFGPPNGLARAQGSRKTGEVFSPPLGRGGERLIHIAPDVAVTFSCGDRAGLPIGGLHLASHKSGQNVVAADSVRLATGAKLAAVPSSHRRRGIEHTPEDRCRRPS